MTNASKWTQAIGVTEVDPPPFPWRPLRAILAQPSFSPTHLWCSASACGIARGAELPSGIFDARVEEGLVLRLPEPIVVPAGHALVRTSNGEFISRDASALASERRRFLQGALTTALECYHDGRTEEAVDWLFQARLAEDTPPLASVLLGGLALEEKDDDWRDLALGGSEGQVGALELDLVRDDLTWDKLPCAKIRERWFGEVEHFLRMSRRLPPLEELYPVPRELRRHATLILQARQLLSICALRSLRHTDLQALTFSVPSRTHRAASVEAVLSQLEAQIRSAVDAGTGSTMTQPMTDALHTGVLGAASVQTMAPDFDRHARTLARLEATLGDSSRREAWRSTSAKLNRIRHPLGHRPWEAGQLAAHDYRVFLNMDDQSPLPSFCRWLRHTVGIALFPAVFDSEDYEACHFVSRVVPPVSYLDSREAASYGPRTRFVAATSIGFQIFSDGKDDTVFARHPNKPVGATLAEKAANAFAAYFLAPRSGVQQRTATFDRQTEGGYREAVATVMREFGLSYSAAYPHVANCHGEKPPFRWFTSIEEYVRSVEAEESLKEEWRKDRITVPTIPEDFDIPLERADGFTNLLVEAVAGGQVDEEQAVQLLGGPPEQARAFFRLRSRMAGL
jgi:Zn-dependent peptidase ImmA (M78 family)